MPKFINDLLISLVCISPLLVSCSKSAEPPKIEKNNEADNIAIVEEADKSKEGVSAPIVDIMKPLEGTHPCFSAVELIRDEGDRRMYKGLGIGILLPKGAPEDDSQKTYIGIIGKMIQQGLGIPAIRQALLDKCISLKSKGN